MKNYKEETKNTYNKYPKEFSKKFEEYFDNFVKKEAELFLQALKGKKILDVGLGPGIHAEYFKKLGYEPFCIDISKEMIKLCKNKGLKAEINDIENFKSNINYDGIWAYTILLHIPKTNIPSIIKKISNMLKPKGIFALALKEGQGEGFESKEEYPETQRWFSYFTESEVKKLCEDYFELLNVSKTLVKQELFANYLFQKK